MRKKHGMMSMEQRVENVEKDIEHVITDFNQWKHTQNLNSTGLLSQCPSGPSLNNKLYPFPNVQIILF
jgi:hypothetical protein